MKDYVSIFYTVPKGVGRKFSREWRSQRKTDQKLAKKTKNNTF